MSEMFTFAAGDGEITVASRGARVLNCRVEGLDENTIYDDGKGLGGDRLWIAPEVAFYWPSIEDARTDPKGTTETPADVDPGMYEIEGEADDAVQLVNSCSLIDCRDDKAIGLQIKRTIGTAPRPEALPDGVKCASFAITNELRVTGGHAGAVASAWDILQVPPTGTLICPTTRRAEPRSYYEPFGNNHVVVEDDAVRFLIDTKLRVKMGIRPEDTRGCMGYYRPAGDGSSVLIFRTFDVHPDDTYIDIPRDHPADQRDGGDALQAYNDDLSYGHFGEMECVFPAVTVGGSENRKDACATHVLVGPDDAVCQAGAMLLGVPVSMIK
ncbi:MAG: DUF6786 family protein [Planctomycetota bacterium]